MKAALTNKILYTLAAAACVYLLAVDQQPAEPPKPPMPDASTCRAIDGWTAQIDEEPDGSYACIMRRIDGRGVKKFVYGEVK